MGKKISLGAAVAVAGITAAVTVSLTYVYAMNSFNEKVADVNERQAMYTKLSEIDQKARQDYVGEINETQLTDGICAGYIAGLGDLQAQYMSAERYKTYQTGTAGKNTGVGIKTVMDEDGNMEVIQVMPNSPRSRAASERAIPSSRWTAARLSGLRMATRSTAWTGQPERPSPWGFTAQPNLQKPPRRARILLRMAQTRLGRNRRGVSGNHRYQGGIHQAEHYFVRDQRECGIHQNL